AVALRAGLEFLDLDFLLATEGGFLETDLEVVAKIGSALFAIAIGALSAAAKELLENAAGAASAPRATEDLAEDIEGIVEAAAGPGADAALRKGGVAEAVVSRAFLRVSEDVVSLGELLEFLLGRVVARIFVRVKFHR